MGFKQSIRKRFDTSLQSHQVEDDYSTPRRSHSAATLSSQDENFYNDQTIMHHSQSSSRIEMVYDPNELAPSYESVVQATNVNRPIMTTNSSSSSNSSNSSLPIVVTPPKSRSNRLKLLGLKFLNAKQHFALAICRDISLIPPLIGLIQSWKRIFFDPIDINTVLTSARLPEHFLTGIWCIVSAYLSYSVLDGLIVRWIVTYSIDAAIVRVLSMSTIILAIEQYLVSTFLAKGHKYGLHIWILISCFLTIAYIVQNFITSNIDLRGKRRARFFDFYNIVVFAVVPVGLASFITMIGLLRSLLILRIDIDKLNNQY